MRRFSKKRNAVSESDTTAIQELQDLKDSIDKNNPLNEQNFFPNQISNAIINKKSAQNKKSIPL